MDRVHTIHPFGLIRSVPEILQCRSYKFPVLKRIQRFELDLIPGALFVNVRPAIAEMDERHIELTEIHGFDPVPVERKCRPFFP